jgi:diguanylate cyclase (GGDEF)-like protein
VNGRSVLIVDPSRAAAAELAGALAREGYFTRLASRGAEAVAQVQGRTPPDLVLMDLALPDMDGVEALRRMKAGPGQGFLPVLLMASGADLERRVGALREGADDFLPRPCPAAEVAARVAVMLRIRAAQEGLREANQALERASITDPLTGLFNRRYFELRLRQELERSRRYGAPLGLLFLDLDHFKRVNDRYGHPVGDRALQSVSELLGEQLRRMDVCTRWGGEEFAVLMPNADRAGSLVVAQRVLGALRSRVRLHAPPAAGRAARPEPIRLTASLGVAVFPGPGLSGPEQLLEAADGALLAAKRGGRNRICEAGEPARAREPSPPLRAAFA